MGSITGHSQYMPLPQSWTASEVNKALEKIRADYQGYPTARQVDVLLSLQKHEKRITQAEKRVTDHQTKMLDKLASHDQRITQNAIDLNKNVDAIVKAIQWIKEKAKIR